MSRQAPAGWYADPGEPGQLRWWDGSDWAADTVAPTPAPDAAPAVTTPPAPSAQPADSAAPAAPAAKPRSAPAGAARSGTPSSSTVWIWLAIAASALPLYTGVFLDARTIVRLGGPSGGLTPAGWIAAALALLVVIDVVLVAAAVLFACLDHRALRGRGIDAPFAWGWAALAFVLTLGVYVVGRTVVVQRRTGGGLAPLWTWAAVTVVGLVVFAVWIAGFSEAAWVAVTTSR